jgi:RNA polymerase sigma-32 factor
MDVKPEEVEEMQIRLNRGDLSLDAPVGENEDQRYGDFVAAETPDMEAAIDQAEFKDLLEGKLREFSKGLNEREKKIFHERLLSEVPLTLQAIADQYGISRERARQIEERIKTKLKEFFKKEGVKVEDHW